MISVEGNILCVAFYTETMNVWSVLNESWSLILYDRNYLYDVECMHSDETV